MINISCDNICLQYGIDTVLDKVSFSLNEQDKLGIVGVNGAGKSSLLKIIAGKISNFTGDVYISKDKTLGFFEQNTGLDSNKKILEEMLCAFDNLIKMEADIDNLHTSIETYAENSPELEKLVASYTKLRETFESLGGYQFRSRCKGILKTHR